LEKLNLKLKGEESFWSKKKYKLVNGVELKIFGRYGLVNTWHACASRGRE